MLQCLFSVGSGSIFLLAVMQTFFYGCKWTGKCGVNFRRGRESEGTSFQIFWTIPLLEEEHSCTIDTFFHRKKSAQTMDKGISTSLIFPHVYSRVKSIFPYILYKTTYFPKKSFRRGRESEGTSFQIFWTIPLLEEEHSCTIDTFFHRKKSA
jgi:hypothetical protein